MKLRAVLLIGMEGAEVEEMVFNLGFTPMVRRTMAQVVDKVRRDGIAAVLIRRSLAEFDPLELALNVRDLSETIPIIVFGPMHDTEEDRALARLPATFFIENPTGNPAALQRIERIITGGEN